MLTRKNAFLWAIAWTILMLVPLTTSAATYKFQEMPGIAVDILSREEFDTTFGTNPDVPQKDDTVVALAKKLFPPHGQRHLLAKTDLDSREYEVGVLFAALRNPSISSSTLWTVDSIVAAAAPVLPKSYTSGHFKFYYTDNDADPKNNVTLAQIEATATSINASWDKYASNFKEPKHYVAGAKKMVDVYVYDLGPGLYGETSSSWNYINLNSDLTVKDGCRRKTVSAHELFHRVQYAYGYVSGTANLKWIVEGTASWSQKYTYAAIRDYMSRMISGLSVPDKNLITQRSYDAAHLWVYLQKRAGSAAIRDVWQTFSTNGGNAKAAISRVLMDLLGINFEQFAAQWAQANYVKDLNNPGSYEYDEDEATATSCGVTYGPLNQVPKTVNILVKNSTSWGRSDTLKPYGADYYLFRLDPKLTSITLKLDGDDAGKFRYYILGLKNNSVKSRVNVITPDYTYKKTLSPGQWDEIVLIAAGGSTGGTYTVKINNTCIAGQWLDNYGNEYYLDQVTSGVTGWVSSPYCTRWKVAGTYAGNDIEWTMSGSPDTQCCDWKATAEVDDTCSNISGTWVNLTCSGSGSISINKTQDMSIDPPTGPFPGLAQ